VSSASIRTFSGRAISVFQVQLCRRGNARPLQAADQPRGVRVEPRDFPGHVVGSRPFQHAMAFGRLGLGEKPDVTSGAEVPGIGPPRQEYHQPFVGWVRPVDQSSRQPAQQVRADKLEVIDQDHGILMARRSKLFEEFILD
jgi:hypothetical protein